MMSLEVLDRVFLVVFARYRRKSGDHNIGSMWRLASNKVCGYLALGIIALVGIGLVPVYALIEFGTRKEHRLWGQVVAIVAALLVGFWLDHRFKK